MTPSIARFMVEMARVWDEHTGALLGQRDLAAATEHLAAAASPAGRGATGRAASGRER